ncbi:hypothetical protein AA958_18135 [Streptomyces sp. CNQ-509]|uniref:hypothetical protein n=1 Tax=unclassified Streptomyces TaxID=2593676 RepID=UPI00062DD115|nr:hypothetical protein [Streptomyces sp. CNQ-509]AKH83809.1 hypothetical protein AA958_18135 [Streptomyces sp. CNQ-509]
MKRHPLPAAAATAAALALFLAACGGSETDSNEDEKVTGANSAKPSPSPSETEAARPEIKLPDDAKNVFEDWGSSDPEKDAVLRDSAQMIDSIDDAIFKGTTETEALDFYLVGAARQNATDYIKGYLDESHAWAGTTRFTVREVSKRDDGATVVIYCSDESDSYITNVKTGKPIKDSSGGSSAYVLYNTRYEKNKLGVWQMTDGISERGAEQCES